MNDTIVDFFDGFMTFDEAIWQLTFTMVACTVLVCVVIVVCHAVKR